MPEQKQFLDFRGLQLYHKQVMTEISKVEDKIPTISVKDGEESLVITYKNQTN